MAEILPSQVFQNLSNSILRVIPKLCMYTQLGRWVKGEMSKKIPQNCQTGAARNIHDTKRANS